MSEIGGVRRARPTTMRWATRWSKPPWLGSVEVGNSGFRFARIDLVDLERTVLLKEVQAILAYRDILYLGSFRCSDERLNRIWQTGAYTVYSGNMQHYLWDGIAATGWSGSVTCTRRR